MLKSIGLAGVMGAAAMTMASPAIAQIADGSFETQAPAEIGGDPSGYCYGPGPTCTGVNTPWEATLGGGFQLETNAAWPGTDTPAGSYYGFIQAGGWLTQEFTADATGSFILEFLDAGRNRAEPFSGNQFYEVLLNGSSIFSGATTEGQPFTARVSDPFNLVMGQLYTLSFHGLTSTDETAYIDDVRLAVAVPEPATWAMMLLGFGAIGFNMRRRKPVLQIA